MSKICNCECGCQVETDKLCKDRCDSCHKSNWRHGFCKGRQNRPKGEDPLDWWLSPEKLDFIPITGCWLSHASTDKWGYPGIGVKVDGENKRKKLGVLVLERKIGRLLKEGHTEELSHLCNNKLCVNPDHLIAEPGWKNLERKFQAGRQAKGEKHGNARLTQKQVNQIRWFYEQGIHTQKELAFFTGKKRRNINDIVNYRTWG